MLTLQEVIKVLTLMIRTFKYEGVLYICTLFKRMIVKEFTKSKNPDCKLSVHLFLNPIIFILNFKKCLNKLT